MQRRTQKVNRTSWRLEKTFVNFAQFRSMKRRRIGIKNGKC
jgi:hypothetical protein